MLHDAEGRPCRQQDAPGTLTTWQYEVYQPDTPNAAPLLPGRLLSVREQTTGEATARTTQRLVYADRSGTAPEENRARNRCGTVVRHYDAAGLATADRYALSGALLQQSRTLLQDAADDADWAGDDEAAWRAQLEQGDDARHTTRTTVNAAGLPLTQTGATGHTQRTAYDVAGRVSGSWLTLSGGTEQPVLVSLTWSAAGQKLQEVHGNGVTTDYVYEPQTQRLTGTTTTRGAAAKGSAAGTVLQALRYGYDPAGNVLSVSDDAQETTFWRNQKVVPESTFAYDSLYQLIRATGRENAAAGQQGRSLPPLITPLPADSSQYTNYTRTYAYDAGGNLTQIRHSAPATSNSYTTAMTVSHASNRAVLSSLTDDPARVDGYFDAAGHQLNPGFSATNTLVWDPRGNLKGVTTVSRTAESGAGATTNDGERYRYDGQSQRLRKVSQQQTGSGTQTRRVTYLPGLELRRTRSGDTTTESLQVITVGEAGRAQVRALHWESGKPDGVDNDRVRYSVDGLTGSSGLELDGTGQVISREEYYPYGGTAVWAARSATEADYKTVRYSGKERDATGLYYYGYRYYQPWAGRWLSADPAGTVDGLNLYRMVRNNPVVMRDTDGRGCFSCCCGNDVNKSHDQPTELHQLPPLSIISNQPQSVNAGTTSSARAGNTALNQSGLSIPVGVHHSPLTPEKKIDDISKNQAGQSTIDLLPKPKPLIHMLHDDSRKPKMALRYSADEFFKKGNETGPSSESQRQAYGSDNNQEIREQISNIMKKDSSGVALGPVQNGLKRISELLPIAIDYGYQMDNVNVQHAFSNYVMIYVTEGFEDEDTTGTLVGNATHSTFGGFMDMNKAKRQ
ncbi:Cell wall-associated polypeptide [Enterobacter sp. DC4]|uniref:RHS repeat-associated core domain-containing protein n=1 Tax=Enterobacter sp. DC4 TaxID=1395580 RepID=UPI0003ECF7F0|nr:RHS repeat-associated core domain-containing protein [Enterobacter sp. DC4]EWG65588.1 Cell wall-associated polypeptide [Enterobacter sp. DC4]